MSKWYRKRDKDKGEGESETARPSSKRGSSSAKQSDTTPQAEAYQKALGMLVKREHSRKEMQRKLSARGMEDDDVDAALEQLSRSNFQSDERFASALARTRAMSGYGPVRIRAELGTHSLSRDLIDQAMETVDTDFAETAMRLLSRKSTPEKLTDPAQRRKAVDFLLRRGFEQRMVYSIVKKYGAAQDELDD